MKWEIVSLSFLTDANAWFCFLLELKRRFVLSLFCMGIFISIPVITSVCLKMWSNQVCSYLFTGISGLGVFLNFKSFAYIRKTFDTTNNLFNILAKDALATGICSGIFCTTNLIMLFNEELLTDKVGCAMHFAGAYLPAVLGPVTSLLISLRRFLQLKYPTTIALNSSKVNLISTVILIATSIYHWSYMFFDILTGRKAFNFAQVCLGEHPEVNPSKVSAQVIPPSH